MRDNTISIRSLMENNAIASGETEYSNPIPVKALRPNGDFSLHLELDAAGTAGTATVFYEATNIEDATVANRFVKPANADIWTAFAKNGGEGADGKDIRDFNIETCSDFRIGVTANGGAVKIKRLIAALQ
jgi:hypothetical protein